MPTDRPASLLIVTGCSASKRMNRPGGLGYSDLADKDRREALMREFGHLALPARDMYTGRHHQAVFRAVDEVRRAWPAARVEVAIVSAGYGLLDEQAPILAYNASFAGLSPVAAAARARTLAIPDALRRLLSTVEASVFLLSEAYLAPLDAPFRCCRLEVYFAAPGLSLAGPGIVHVRCGVEQAKHLGLMSSMTRAALFQRFVRTAMELGWSDALGAARRNGLGSLPEPFGQLALAGA